MQKVRITLEGTSPLIMHNGRLIDPLDAFSRQMKTLSSKRGKTDADHEELARVEFEGGMYWDDELGPYVPAENIEASIKEGARLSKNGKKVERGLSIEAMIVPLIFTGPRDIQSLYDGGYSHRKAVKVGQAKIMRTRPIFQKWALETEAFIDPNVLNTADLANSVTAAGRLIGLCDFRPRFGRYIATVVEVK